MERIYPRNWKTDIIVARTTKPMVMNLNIMENHGGYDKSQGISLV